MGGQGRGRWLKQATIDFQNQSAFMQQRLIEMAKLPATELE